MSSTSTLLLIIQLLYHNPGTFLYLFVPFSFIIIAVINIPGMYTYVCVNFSNFCQLFSSYEYFSAKREVLGHGKPGRTHWSRSRRDPCTLERVAGAQSFSFPAGVDRTISLVSVREALLCTYVPVYPGNIIVCFLLIYTGTWYFAVLILIVLLYCCTW